MAWCLSSRLLVPDLSPPSPASERADRKSAGGNRNPDQGGNFGQDQSDCINSGACPSPYGTEVLVNGGWVPAGS